MKKNKLVATAALSLLTLSGCATITRGTSQAWTVNTQPSDAAITLSNGETCRSPCTLKLKRKYPFGVDICKQGYTRVATVVQTEVKGGGAAGMAGNVLVGGIIGVGVDATSGAMKDLTPNPLHVTLEADEPGCDEPRIPDAPEGAAPVKKTRK